MFIRIIRTATISVASLALVACGAETETEQVTGANLTIDYFGDTDVIGFQVTVDRVACAPGEAFEPSTEQFDINLLDGVMPGMVSLLEQRLAQDTRHLGSDLFVSLDPGCYDITFAPASGFEPFVPSADCQVTGTADDAPVVVENGSTAEPPLLISQCIGDERGALDTPVALNTPPVVDVEIEGSKFAYECQPLTVCATATDDNDDPIELVWSKVRGHNPFDSEVGPMELIGFESGHRIWRQCLTVTNRFVGDYDWSVTAYDLGKRGNQTVRIEALVAPATSHFSLEFPMFVNWVEEPLCYDGAGDLVLAEGVAPIERAAGCGYTTSEEYYCGDMFERRSPGSRAFTCPDGEFDPTAVYPDCD